MSAKTGWFGPRTGMDAGYQDIWGAGYDLMPVTWQGWLATLVYVALQITAGFALFQLHMVVAPELLAVAILLQIVLLHLVYLRFAAYHCTAPDEYDPQPLPFELWK